MSLSCLKDYIGILGGSITPDSGMYINSLPGLPLERFDKIVNADQVTYLQCWSNIQDRALAKFSNDVNAQLRKRYRLKTVSRSLDAGKNIDTTQVSAPIAEYRGFAVEMTFHNTYKLVYSNFQVLSVQTLRVYLTAKPLNNADLVVNIIDMDSQTVLDTFTVTNANCVVGWNEIKVNEIYQGVRLFIGYDATNIPGVYEYFYPNINQYFTQGVWDLYGSFFENGFIRGAQSVNKSVDVPAYGVSSFGMSGVFSLLCTYDNFVCNNQASFADSLLYLLGAETIIESKFSPRFSRWTTSDAETNEELLAYFQNEYEKNLEQMIFGIDLDTNDICLECNAPIQRVNTTL